MTQMHKSISGPALIAAGLVMALLSAPSAVQANEERILYSFRGGADGANPNAGLVADHRGNLYGVTNGGGAYNLGVLFKMTKGRNRVLHSFGAAGDGASASCRLLIDEAGNLYGTTDGGGTSFLGTVFKLATDKTYTVLHSFTGGSDGAGPVSDLIADASGNLYGTTNAGGTGNCTGGCGTVFKVTSDGQETVLYSFEGGLDGTNPKSGLVADAEGNLYGTTFFGGTNLRGTVFKLTPAGEKTILYSFTGGTDGDHPYTDVVMDAAGNLYGTTQFGGGFGNVYKLAPDGVETVLYAFAGGTDGSSPNADLIIDAAGNLYSTLINGGPFSLGQVYEVAPNGTKTNLHSFGAGGDGSTPLGPLYQDAKGNLYGTTYYGGGGSGCIFKVFN